LTAAGLEPSQAIPLLTPLLNLSLPAEYPQLGMSPEQQRRRLLATLVEWVLGAARGQPLVMAIEDLHWVDPSTLELIQLLVEQGATSRLLLLYTARPEFHAPWATRTHHALITLNRLGTRDVRRMVAQVTASTALSDDTIATVVERTGGVPLFVEELTRAVLESGDAKLIGHQIPATLHDSLMARLDRLGPAKEVIQIGAVIGSEFSYELLRAIHPIGDGNLQEALDRLAEAELLYVRGIAPDATYQFKHALIRDAAYEALLRTRRKEVHLIIAQTIDEKFSTIRESRPEVLARHWTEAGEIERAIAEWSRAGKAAEPRGAFAEALEGYHQALVQLDLLPESPGRDHRELELLQSVVWTLYVTKSHGSPETIAATERAAVLAERGGNLSQLVISLFSRGLASLIAGDLLTGLALEDQALILALRDSNPAHLGVVRVHQMLARNWIGDLVGVEGQFSAGLELFENADFRRFPGAAVGGFGFASLNAWTRGYSEVALQREAEMRSAANENNPYDMALAQGIAGYIQIYCGKFDQAQALAQAALEISEGHQISQVGASSLCVLGHARAQLGHAREGIELLRRGISGLLEVGSRLGLTREFTYLAQARQLNGDLGDALETVEKALQMNPEELLFRPEILRVRGEIQFKLGKTELAEADFREAIALAQSMGAKAWELRATMSLARLIASQGRREEARTMLAEIYNWFTEGFDTADLIDAKALLDQLQ
jgi:tetratricopeptide (TPR) repeat protein